MRSRACGRAFEALPPGTMSDEKKGAEAYETQAYEALEKDFQAVS